MKPWTFVGATAAGALFYYFATQSVPAAIGGLATVVVLISADLERKVKDINIALEMQSKRVFPELWP